MAFHSNFEIAIETVLNFQMPMYLLLCVFGWIKTASTWIYKRIKNELILKFMAKIFNPNKEQQKCLSSETHSLPTQALLPAVTSNIHAFIVKCVCVMKHKKRDHNLNQRGSTRNIINHAKMMVNFFKVLIQTQSVSSIRGVIYFVNGLFCWGIFFFNFFSREVLNPSVNACSWFFLHNPSRQSGRIWTVNSRIQPGIIKYVTERVFAALNSMQSKY